MNGLVSVGYEGRAAGELVALLRDNGVTLLVDVRLNPISRKPGFSKNVLTAALAEAGIGYRHVRALGNPKANRPAFEADPARGVESYRAHLATPEAAAALADLRDLAAAERVAVLCLERDEARCHRQAVVAEVDPDALRL